jgi:cytoskeletal protein CcmA (bactofilin family)
MAANPPEETELPQVINLSNVSVENVEAELVRTNQTSIEQLNAEEVELHISALGTARAGNLHAKDSILGVVISEQATVQDSITGGVRAQSLSLNGVTVLALANSMSIEAVDAVVVAGTQISAENIRTGILISQQVNGNVTTMVDGRTVLLAGLAGGTVAGLILLAGKLLFGRKK